MISEFDLTQFDNQRLDLDTRRPVKYIELH
jgi:hypothetical protein